MSSLLVLSFTIQVTILASDAYTDHDCLHHYGLPTSMRVCMADGFKSDICFSNPWLPWSKDQDQTWLVPDTRHWYKDVHQPPPMANEIGPGIYVPIILLSLKILFWICYCCCKYLVKDDEVSGPAPAEAGYVSSADQTPLSERMARPPHEVFTMTGNDSTTGGSSSEPPAYTPDPSVQAPPPSYHEAVNMESLKVDSPQQKDITV